MKEIPFVKMQGAGNDFVFLSREKTGVAITPRLARLLLDRHFGIGGDQLLVLEKTRKGKDPVLHIFNADGSKAEMCGNGVRAVAAHLIKEDGVKSDFTIRTKAGPIGINVLRGAIEVDMGEPEFEGARIPVRAAGSVVDRPLKVGRETFRINCVSMGNPHCVIFMKNVKKFPVAEFGPMIETHPFFPRRTNVEFVEILSRSHARARVWERGAGETLACGTGACAAAAMAAWTGKTGRKVKIDLPGGALFVRWDANNRFYLTGPAQSTFEGKFRIK